MSWPPASSTACRCAIIGALAFHHHCPQFGWIQAKLNRVYTDIDFAGYGKQSKQIRDLFIALGYDEDVEINSFHAEAGRLDLQPPRQPHPRRRLHGPARLLPPHPLEGPARGRQPTIPLAELVLEKMQIVKINEKDIIDTIMLLREHEIAARRRRPRERSPGSPSCAPASGACGARPR